MSQCGEEEDDLLPRSGRADRDSPPPGCVSLQSHRSMDPPMVFKPERPFSLDSSPSCVSLSSNLSKELPKQNLQISQIQQEESVAGSAHLSDLDSIFKSLEENINAFVKEELQQLQNLMRADCSEDEDEDEDGDPGEEQRKSSREAFHLIALRQLRRMKHLELAQHLENKTSGGRCRLRLKSSLRKRFQCVFEGIAKAGNASQLNVMYTELLVTEGGTAEVNSEHEVRQIERASRKAAAPETTIRCEDLFKHSPGREEPVRTVITKGVAGIGKTLLTQKFALDWAEDRSNQHLHFTFPFSFRELNLLRDRRFSLVGLLHHFFPETREAGICRFDEFRVLFIFDGLDECRLPLDLYQTRILSDVSEPASVEVLLANLIWGRLLPAAHIWITTRPAAAHRIPPEAVDVVTEVRGFTDPQKEEYFRKRFGQDQADSVIAHIKRQRSVHIMCHIPVFCWISATVLEEMLKTSTADELPRTLTRMYIQFLVVQSKRNSIKYDGGAEKDPHWSPDTQKMIASLGKLAFEQLLKGNIFFYRGDLTECGIDVKSASVYSGVFTQMFQEESLLYPDKVFCFVHLSVQEFLAALHVHMAFVDTGVNLLSDQKSASLMSKLFGPNPLSLYQCAVDKALQSPTGHLDLFLRFLLGLSLQENQAHLQGLVTQTGNSSLTNQRTAEYIRTKISESPSLERSINLFQCLKELRDCSLMEEIQKSLRSGSLPTDGLSAAHWSALVFILLSSDEALDEFDLKKFCASEEALLKLLPVVKASTKAVLSQCNLTARSCQALASVLSSQSCSLKELDLSNNDLQDSGVKQLCEGLQSPHCPLQALSLSGCQITKEGFSSLVSVLTSNPRLKELDLTYNHPGDSARKKLSGGRQVPNWGLETLRMDPGGPQFLKPGLRKYGRKLTLDPNTANRKLVLSDNNRMVTVGDRQPYPDHPERFDYWKQVLGSEGLRGRCYWEAEWDGQVYVAVAYRGIKRKGEGSDSCLGRNEQSWSLHCSPGGYSYLPGDVKVSVPDPASTRVGVYLDWPAGTLSFFQVLPDRLVPLHTVHTCFTEPVYPAFRIRVEPFCSSLSLCDI